MNPDYSWVWTAPNASLLSPGPKVMVDKFGMKHLSHPHDILDRKSYKLMLAKLRAEANVVGVKHPSRIDSDSSG